MFKVIYNDIVIDLLETVKWVRCLKKSGRIVNTDKSSAHGFYGSDNKTVYIMEGKYCPPDKNFKLVRLQPINEAEYKELYDKLLNKVLIQANLVKLRETKIAKINELSEICNKTITDGISVLFNDGYYHKFRLTLEDQINIEALRAQVDAGATKLIYHETNKVVELFDADDIKRLIQAANKHRLYHTTYFNILKHCINNMYNTDEVNRVQYGDSIDLFDVSDDIKRLLKESRNG